MKVFEVVNGSTLSLSLSLSLFADVTNSNANVFGVSTESMQLSYDSRGNSVPTVLLMQNHLYAQCDLQSWSSLELVVAMAKGTRAQEIKRHEEVIKILKEQSNRHYEMFNKQAETLEEMRNMITAINLKCETVASNVVQNSPDLEG